MSLTSHQVDRSIRRPPRPVLAAQDVPSLRAGLVTLVPELRGRALRLAANAALADDMVQDTIERALRFADQYEPGTNLRAWVFQILFSVFITRYRRQRRERNALRILSTDPCAWTIPPANGSPEHEVRLTLSTKEKLDALPDGFRSVIVLVDLQERSYREAAVELGLPLGTVMSRLHRGRKLLAAQLAA
ncbi:RNA polymerase sigma factor [Pendulispora rubella]|uniref:RNA polymerase sigma factor n=1 Tax=Pendulispora rubella TaxID=2741070 RepID=A0ABZ2KUI3_9BACT